MNTPVPLVLDLWSLGHTSGQIAAQLGLPDRWHVVRIIEHARDIGDPRAAVHVGKNGKAIGHPRWAVGVLANAPETELVPAIGKAHCKHGHPRTPENVDARSNCRACKRIVYARIKAAKR